MNLPNKLTMMRVIMVPFFMVFAAMSHMGTPQFNATYALIAGILFAVASFTDFLDGYLARKNHLVTDFGKFMDPPPLFIWWWTVSAPPWCWPSSCSASLLWPVCA